MTEETLNKIVTEITTSEMTAEEIAQVRDTIQKSKGGMTEEQYKSILEALDKAQESTRPFTVVANENLAVVGDANDTKINKFTYEVNFTHPVKDDDGNIIGTKHETKTYKNIFITPRQSSRVTKIIVMILPYFRKVDENGNVVEYTMYEMAEIFVSLDEAIYDVMYDLVAYILGIPEEEKEYMELSSVIKVVLRLLNDFPEAVNEAESFFE